MQGADNQSIVSLITEGGDQITTVLTFLLLPITLLDNRANHWSRPAGSTSLIRKFIGNVFFAIIALQMSIVYFHAAVEKLYKSIEWRNGTALYYFSNDPQFGFPDPLLLVFNKLLPEAGVASTRRQLPYVKNSTSFSSGGRLPKHFSLRNWL